MTRDELIAFVAEVRTEVDAIFARLSELDPSALPPEVRAVYDDVRQQAFELRTIAEAHASELFEAACAKAGRELTSAELCGLFGLH